MVKNGPKMIQNDPKMVQNFFSENSEQTFFQRIFFDLVFFSCFHVRDRGLDRSARQDGFVFEKRLL